MTEEKNKSVELTDDDLEQVSGGAIGWLSVDNDDDAIGSIPEQSATRSQKQTKASYPICHK
jgi:bacteriocin-like protein